MAAEPFRHLHIRLDANAGPQCFIKYNALLYEDERVLAVVRQTTNQSFGQVEMDKPVQREDVVQSMLGLVARYRQGGFDAVAAMVASNVPADKCEELLEACFKVSQTLPGELYLELLADEGVDIEQGFSAKEGLFLGEALAGSVYAYGRYQSLMDGYETGILFGTGIGLTGLGWRGAPMAWWAAIGLFVTLFAFLGVNMFLSGLHSYGEL